MTSYEGIYSGTDYGFDSTYGKVIANPDASSRFGITTDPRTANQLKEVFAKLSTGAKVIEVEGLMPEVLDSIPNQHFEELNRLRKLTGAELTFHGPLVEPTGIGKDRWDESQRQNAENQIWGAVERANKIDENGNVIVTIHASNGLPEPIHRMIDEKGKEVETNLFVIDERTGRMGQIPKPAVDYFTDEKEPPGVTETLKKYNEDNWVKTLSNLNFEVSRGRQSIRSALELGGKIKEDEENKSKKLAELWTKAKEDPRGYQKEIETIRKEISPLSADMLQQGVEELSYGEGFINNVYVQLKELYNEAYEAAKINNNQDSLNKLKEFREELIPLIKNHNNPSKLSEFSEEVANGVRLLSSLKEPPKTFVPLREFAEKKASETFSNVAFKAYEKFGNKAPILSIENPPAGMGLSRADEIAELIEKTRTKFEEKVMKEKGLSKSEAMKQSERLIGATWDVGHINMIRKHGFEEKHLLEETKTIAPFVKHVHLSDNFGMEHTELPMGMGNVPVDKELEIIEKYNKQVKKIIETGGAWYKDFQMSPLKKTFERFGSPVYSSKMSPSWNNTGMMGDYFVGQGTINPEIHHTYFGAGFTTLPSELGGQMPGGKSKFSGAPME